MSTEQVFVRSWNEFRAEENRVDREYERGLIDANERAYRLLDIKHAAQFGVPLGDLPRER